MTDAGGPDDPLDREVLPWWEPLGALLDGAEIFDAHTHIGANDPDGYAQTPAELLAALRPLDARALVFPMQEPDGYAEANDVALGAAAASDRLLALCRVDPRASDALAEARRCLDAGARGIKLHPRAERFTLSEPTVDGLVALAHERRAPVLIHAGRGIPALGRDAVELAARYPEARLILAHAGISDLGWLCAELPRHPNLLLDTAWWSPGDMMALFSLVPSGQILWASDSPYARPLPAATMHLRFAIQAGVEAAGLRSIAGGQLARLVAGEGLEQIGRPSGEEEPLSPHLERIVAHLVAAMGAAISGGEIAEPLSLARLACDVAGDAADAELIARVFAMLDRAEELARTESDGARFPPSVQLLLVALTIARTPRAPLPRVR